jgi:magnesium transporter
VPLTFLAGVYGMNFKYIPELDVQWAYPAFWGICVSMAVAMLLWFKRRHWL